MALTARELTCVYAAELESCDVDSCVSGMPPARSCDQVTLLQKHTIAAPLEASRPVSEQTARTGTFL